MIRIPVKKLKTGMIVSQSIYNKRGASYLVKGQRITMQYIRQLKKIGIPTVTVTSSDPSINLPPPEDIVQEKTRVTAIEKVFDAFQSVEETGRLDASAMEDVADKIIFDVIQRRENLVQLTDIRLHDAYTFAHSVNVAILSAMVGNLCHFSKDDLFLLTLGALLHDLGKVSTPLNILNKTTSLDQDEFATIREHPINGAKRIHSMEHLLPSPGILAAIASQHHEHMDGTGYPYHLQGDQIHRFARIVAIADVYDALTSERPYKKAYTPSLAHNIMTRVSQSQFDPKLMTLFFDNVALYPVGTILKTVYGFGIVRESHFGHTQTPIVCIFADKERNILEEPVVLDLTSDGPKAVEMVINGNELHHFIHEIHFDPTMYLLPEENEN
ncbi:MAG: HD-GYP domain-containing protein [Selenomonadaceae bacterium]|nr:HD-GYP domain-containing protein [Selenomonadaceae bacterium]